MIRSLQSRLSIGLTISIIVLLFAQWLAVSFTIRHVAEDFVASRLQHDAEDLLTLLQLKEGSITVDTSRISSVYNHPFSGHYYIIQHQDKQLRSRSLWDENIATPQSLNIGDILESHTTGPDHQSLLLWQGGYQKDNLAFTISVAEDISHIEEDMTEFIFWYSTATLIATILFILTQLLILRRGLKPLEQVRHEVIQLAQGETRALSEDVPSEVRPLVSEFNRLLTVMAQRMQRSRNATGNLAHALKTPLALLSRLIEHTVLEQTPQLQQQLRNSTQRIQQLMERELKRAQLAGKATSGQQFDFSQELPALVDTLRHIYQEKNIVIDIDVPGGTRTAADREDMLELLGNLLDNACKWAASRVRITVAQRQGITISVEDDGPGCSEQAMLQLTQRGTRIDEEHNSGIDGHGLGLSIVHEIVNAYNGSLQFAHAELGGLAVKIELG